MALVDLAVAVMVEARPLPLGSSLVEMGRVGRTISRLWEASLYLERSLGATRGLVALGNTHLVVFFSFSTTLVYSASFGGLLGEGRALAGMSLLGSVSLGASLALELEGPDARMSGG